MSPTPKGPGRTKAEPEPEHDPDAPDQAPESQSSSEEKDTKQGDQQETQGTGGSGPGTRGALVDPSKSREEVREDQQEAYQEGGDEELSESEKVEQERLEYHNSIQDEIREQQEETGEGAELPSADERVPKTAPAPGQVPGDHIPAG